MKKLLVIVMTIIFALSLCACVKTDTNITNYPSDVDEFKANRFMPALDSIGEYQSAAYFCRRDNGIFPNYSMQLIVQYDDETFESEIERLETAYVYLDEPQRSEWGQDYTIPVTEFSVAEFHFKIAKFDDTQYPKNFGMVGISDEKQEIAYLWIYDPDLDYICEANENELKGMHEFIEAHFSLE